MRLKYDVLLSGDVGYVDKQLVRFGHMGISASVDYLCPTFEAIEMSLEELGFEFKNKGTLKDDLIYYENQKKNKTESLNTLHDEILELNEHMISENKIQTKNSEFNGDHLGFFYLGCRAVLKTRNILRIFFLKYYIFFFVLILNNLQFIYKNKSPLNSPFFRGNFAFFEVKN